MDENIGTLLQALMGASPEGAQRHGDIALEHLEIMQPVFILKDGDASIFIAGYHRSGDELARTLTGGYFTTADVAKEKLGEVIDEIFAHREGEHDSDGAEQGE